MPTLVFLSLFHVPLAIMEHENDSQDAITQLNSDILPGQSLTATLNVSGGSGGRGGRGRQDGGAGGNGEGPVFNVSRAKRLIVHVNEGNALKNPKSLGSAIDSAPPAISICDINLRQEVYSNNLRVGFRHGRNVVRKYYTAEVKDRKEMTVVFYEGQDAEEEFKKDVVTYMKFRHPSFLQLYGTVHSGNIYATIFYDVLIPWRDIDSIYQHSPMVLCYIYASVSNEFKAASGYFGARFGSVLRFSNYTLFLRPSTGRLCIDLGGPDISTFISFIEAENISPMSLLSAIDTQIITIYALTIEQYHRIWYLYFGVTTYAQFSFTTTVHLGAVYHLTGHHNPGSLFAIAPTLERDDWLSRAWYLYQVDPHITESGWNRFAVSELIGRELAIGQNIELSLSATLLWASELWLSQANHVLNRLGVFPNADNSALLRSICFAVELDPQSATPTDWHSLDAFLFLCPPQSFQVGPVSFKCPENVGYWSLDPSGVDRLSAEQAVELGFPTITISVKGLHLAWSATVYAGLRQFHQGKGFDPDSQDLARHLGVPLYQLYPDYEKSLNVDGGDSEVCIEELSSCEIDSLVDEVESGTLDVGKNTHIFYATPRIQ
ncbi:hypothetical protein R3P38DRAFT_601831 [Favolaschia claudopus]|uniref:Protein kinase domain-containing protein n=1 Tax=Favolaschia claudopus TaxID=2862362 RepID=A0AAW0CAL7_9AGAR